MLPQLPRDATSLGLCLPRCQVRWSPGLLLPLTHLLHPELTVDPLHPTGHQL